MKFSTIYLTIIFTFISVSGFCQNNLTNTKSTIDYKCSVFTTYLSVTNFGKPETNTHHYEIQARYQLTDKDAVGIKAATWKLFAPMGIPIWDEKFLDKEAFYPGRLQETGVGVTYQRKLWKGLFATLEILPLKTTYLDESDTEIGSGFKLYNSYHLGYHIPLFKKGRFFIEPQLHVNHWIVNTNVPEAFKYEEAKWNNYFLIEPNLYFGIKF